MWRNANLISSFGGAHRRSRRAGSSLTSTIFIWGYLRRSRGWRTSGWLSRVWRVRTVGLNIRHVCPRISGCLSHGNLESKKTRLASTVCWVKRRNLQVRECLSQCAWVGTVNSPNVNQHCFGLLFRLSLWMHYNLEVGKFFLVVD